MFMKNKGIFWAIYSMLLRVCMRQISEGKSAASFCRQMAAWFPYMFCNFYLVQNNNIAKNSITAKAREKTQ
jgi:hypothetical protein